MGWGRCALSSEVITPAPTEDESPPPAGDITFEEGEGRFSVSEGVVSGSGKAVVCDLRGS